MFERPNDPLWRGRRARHTMRPPCRASPDGGADVFRRRPACRRGAELTFSRRSLFTCQRAVRRKPAVPRPPDGTSPSVDEHCNVPIGSALSSRKLEPAGRPTAPRLGALSPGSTLNIAAVFGPSRRVPAFSPGGCSGAWRLRWRTQVFRQASAGEDAGRYGWRSRPGLGWPDPPQKNGLGGPQSPARRPAGRTLLGLQ